MNAFFATIHTSFRRQLTYRAANLSGLFTNLMFGFFRAAVLIALYQEQTSVNGLSIRGAITYAGLTQSLIGVMSFFHWYDLMHTVYDGRVGADLLRPINYFSYWLAIDIGRALGSLIIRGIPLFLVFSFFYDIILPESLIEWSLFALSILFALLISFSWRFLVNLASFWTPNALGIGRFAFGLSWTLSGFYFPLALFPDWLANFCRLTPFGASLYFPIQVFIGNIQGAELLQGFFIQVFWIVSLVILGHFILNQGVKKLVIQGG